MVAGAWRHESHRRTLPLGEEMNSVNCWNCIGHSFVDTRVVVPGGRGSVDTPPARRVLLPPIDVSSSDGSVVPPCSARATVDVNGEPVFVANALEPGSLGFGHGGIPVGNVRCIAN